MKKSKDIRLSKQALKIHDQWLVDNGYKAQAKAHKLMGSRYKSSDYRKKIKGRGARPQALPRCDKLTRDNWLG